MTYLPILLKHTTRILKNYPVWYQYNNYSSQNASKKNPNKNPNKIKKSYFHRPGDHPFLFLTIGQALDAAAAEDPNKEGVVFCSDKVRKNYAQMKEDADKFAAGLLAIGLEKGDRVALWSLNCYEWIVTQYGVAKAGMVLVNVNPAYEPRELEFCLNKVGVRAIVAAESFKTFNYYKILCTVIQSLPTSKPGRIKDRLENFTHVIMISNNKLGGTFNFNEVCNSGKSENFKKLIELDELIQSDDPCNIQFTSGTTGSPKGATLSHHSVMNVSYVIARGFKYEHRKQRICLPLPLFHAFANVCGSLCGIITRCCQIYPSAFYDAKLTLKALNDEKCTSLFGTPTMFIDLMNKLPTLGEYDLSNLKTGVMSGSTCPEHVLKASIKLLNMEFITCAYGCTELSPALSMTEPGDSFQICTTTVGRIIEHVEMKIVDPISLRIVPIGETGEIWARGFQVMLEYWNDKEKTEEAITKDRWYRTGDLGTVDENGYIKIVGRLKDMIIRGGENVYPREIEEFLHTHPKISEAHVFGVPDDRLGEKVCGWIRLKQNEILTEDDVKAFCKGQMAQFKIPEYIKFVEEFPMTATGKAQKFLMRDQATTELNLSGKLNSSKRNKN